VVRLSSTRHRPGPQQLRLPATIGSIAANKQAGGSVLLSQSKKWNPCRASGRQQALGERLANGFQKSDYL